MNTDSVSLAPGFWGIHRQTFQHLCVLSYPDEHGMVEVLLFINFGPSRGGVAGPKCLRIDADDVYLPLASLQHGSGSALAIERR